MDELEKKQVIQILKDKDNEISKLKKENVEIKELEKDIFQKLKDTQMILEATEIAKNEVPKGKEVELLVSERKKLSDENSRLESAVRKLTGEINSNKLKFVDCLNLLKSFKERERNHEVSKQGIKTDLEKMTNRTKLLLQEIQGFQNLKSEYERSIKAEQTQKQQVLKFKKQYRYKCKEVDVLVDTLNNKSFLKEMKSGDMRNVFVELLKGKIDVEKKVEDFLKRDVLLRKLVGEKDRKIMKLNQELLSLQSSDKKKKEVVVDEDCYVSLKTLGGYFPFLQGVEIEKRKKIFKKLVEKDIKINNLKSKQSESELKKISNAVSFSAELLGKLESTKKISKKCQDLSKKLNIRNNKIQSSKSSFDNRQKEYIQEIESLGSQVSSLKKQTKQMGKTFSKQRKLIEGLKKRDVEKDQTILLKNKLIKELKDHKKSLLNQVDNYKVTYKTLQNQKEWMKGKEKKNEKDFESVISKKIKILNKRMNQMKQVKKEESKRKIDVEDPESQKLGKGKMIQNLKEKNSELQRKYLDSKSLLESQEKDQERLKVQLEGSESKNKKSEKVITVLEEQKKNLLSQMKDLRFQKNQFEKALKENRTVKTISLEHTVSNLQKEHENVQKLMKLITDLRGKNEALLVFKKECMVLRDDFEELKKNIGKSDKYRKQSQKKVVESRAFIQKLLDEKNRLKTENSKALDECNLKILGLEKSFAEGIRKKENIVRTLTGEIARLEEVERDLTNRLLEYTNNTQMELSKKENVILEMKGKYQTDIQVALEKRKQKTAQLKDEIRSLKEEKQEALRKNKKLRLEFLAFKKDNERKVVMFERQCVALKSQIDKYVEINLQLGKEKKSKENLKNIRFELEKELKAVKIDNSKLSGKLNDVLKELKNGRKKNLEDKDNLKRKNELLRESLIDPEKHSKVRGEVKKLKRERNQLKEEIRKKNEVIRKIKNDFNSEISRLEKSIAEHKQFSDKYKKAIRDTTRRVHNLQDYRSRIKLFKAEIQELKAQARKSHSRNKDLASDISRKSKFAKNLQDIIEKKNSIIAQLKKDNKESRKLIEKKDSLLKMSDSRIGRISETEKLKRQEKDGWISTLKSILSVIGKDQLREIERLEKKYNFLREMKYEKKKKKKKKRENQILKTMNTTEIVDGISHTDLGLSVAEMNDLLRSTQNPDREDDERDLNQSFQMEQKRTKKATNVLFLLDKNLDILKNVNYTMENLKSLISIRIHLEKDVNALSIEDTDTEDDEIIFSENPSKNLILDTEVEKKEEENIYDSTIRKLENELLK